MNVVDLVRLFCIFVISLNMNQTKETKKVKNYVDLDHDQLERQWTSIFEKEKAIKEKEEEIEHLTPTLDKWQAWHECDGPLYLAQARKELEELKNS